MHDMHSFWLGFASGVPLMIAVGPIALLLVQLGMDRGARGAWPGAVGVAGADLTFALVAAVSGAAVQAALRPYAQPMRWAAGGVLLVMAAVMLRRAVRELVAVRSGVLHEVAPTVVLSGGPVRLAVRMTGLTLMNPLTIAAFTSLVVATGSRAAAVGWPIGIATASLAVHGGLVLVGASLRRALSPVGTSFVRVGGSVLVAGLAANLLLHA